MINQLHIDWLRLGRKHQLELLEPFKAEQLMQIPESASNHLLWNFGHILVTQQQLCYALSGIEPVVDAYFVNKYRKGTQPATTLRPNEIEELKELCLSTVDQLEQDFKIGVFQNFKPYTVSFGITLNNLEEAIIFNNIHENLHLGYMMALRKHI